MKKYTYNIKKKNNVKTTTAHLTVNKNLNRVI